MNVLVTGGAGFLGSHLSEHLLENGDSVTCLDNFDPFYGPSEKQRNVAQLEQYGKFRLIVADLRQPDFGKAVPNDSFEYVVHLAAQPSVRYSFHNTERVFEVNVKGTQHLLEFIREKPIKRLVLASSSSVYGNHNDLPFREIQSPKPGSPYGVSKVLAEESCQRFANSEGIGLSMLRYFSLYGPRMRPDLAIHRFFSRAIEGEPLEIYGDGTQTRDFTFVLDAVEATVRILEEDADGIFNVGTGHATEILEIARAIRDITESESSIRCVEREFRENLHTMADIGRISAEISWRPRVDLSEGLLECDEWFREVILRGEHAST